MISRRSAIVVTITGLIGATTQVLAATKKKSAVARFDTDNDGTVDLAEAKRAAGDLFDMLDADKDGTLSVKELKGHLSRKDFAAADPDKDDTLTKDEYLALVEQRFKSADADGDGTGGVSHARRSRLGPALGLAHA